MPGITGLVHPQSTDITQQLDRMIAPLRHRSWYPCPTTMATGAGLACVDLDDTMGVAEVGGTHLACFGELTDHPLIRQRLQKAGDTEASDYPLPRLLLQAYLQLGREALEGLNGYYAIALWEAQEERLTLINDRGGVAKVYYHQNGNTFYFGPEIKAISPHLPSNPALDEHTIYDLFSLSHTVQDRTLLRDVKVMTQASILTWQRGQLHIENYWQHHSTPIEDVDAPLEVFTDGYLERLRNAVTRRYHQRDTGLFITGGLDSRVLSGILTDEGHSKGMDAITAGDPWGHDARFARKIALQGGYNHHFIQVGSDYLPCYAPEALRRSEGMTSAHVSWAICSNDMCEAQGLRNMLTGYLGCGGVAANFPLDENPDDAFTVLVDRAFSGLLNEERLKGLLKDSIYDTCYGETLRELRKSYDSLEDLPTASRNEVLRRDEQHRRFISVDLALQGTTTRPLFPYDDVDVWDYLLAIPMQHRRGKRFFLDLINRHYPALARIPRSGDAIPIGGSKLSKLRHRAGQRVYHRILPKITGGRLGGRNLEKGVFYTQWQRTGSRDFILQCLAKTHLYEDVLQVDEVQRQINAHLDGHSNNPGLVHAFVSLIIGRETLSGTQIAE